MTCQDIQKKELAGKTKLTAVTVYVSPGRKTTHFLMLNHDSKGRAILPMAYLNQIVGKIPRGTTFSVA